MPCRLHGGARVSDTMPWGLPCADFTAVHERCRSDCPCADFTAHCPCTAVYCCGLFDAVCGIDDAVRTSLPCGLHCRADCTAVCGRTRECGAVRGLHCRAETALPRVRTWPGAVCRAEDCTAPCADLAWRRVRTKLTMPCGLPCADFTSLFN
jgi:hypothetical protein